MCVSGRRVEFTSCRNIHMFNKYMCLTIEYYSFSIPISHQPHHTIEAMLNITLVKCVRILSLQLIDYVNTVV